jgi:pimeloyl-ACP methyl ester carboxylesterase
LPDAALAPTGRTHGAGACVAVGLDLGPGVSEKMYKTHDTMSARTIELHGRSFAYRQVGAGPVVVLVHGLAGTMGTWNAVLDELATRCTVVTVDLPGTRSFGALTG